MPTTNPPCRVVLFGACDRHNLGDLLFPHVLAALLPNVAVSVAGLLARDLRRYGGHRVRPLADITPCLSGPSALVHAGGELLTCSLVDAALMLAGTGAAPREGEALADWARRRLGGSWPAPYVVGRERVGGDTRLVHVAVGGVALDQADPRLDRAVSTALREADWVSVRDVLTRDALARRGIAARLVPDTAILVRELFGGVIDGHGTQGEPARLRQRFPEGWLAVQASLDFADDASVAALARGCERLARQTGLPIVLFRAGAAPLHDDLGLYRRLRQRVAPAARIHLFRSLDIWDICAVIAGSHGFLGSSLHGRIVALAHGLPRVSIAVDPARPNKLGAFVATWEVADMPGVTPPEGAAQALLAALSRSGQPSRAHADRLARHCRAAMDEWIRALPCPS